MKEYVAKDDLRLMKTEECAGHTIEYAMGWKACIDWIKTLTAADVRPVVRGEWVEDDYGFIRCSACGMEWDEPEHPKTNFCPNCGADMTGGKE